jgi:hypothetical protein
MLRELGVLGVLGVAGMWAAGLVGASYSRVVDRPAADVAAAIADLDIRNAEGAPGTDPTRSGGVTPVFAVEQAADHVSYTVMANGQVAVKMTAWLKPIDDGKRTKVTATVDRGDAPDDYVSPAFRSEGITMGLFSMMLEEEIDKLVFPPKKWTAECDEIVARFEAGNSMNGDPQSMSEAMGETAKAAVALGKLDKELKAAGCPTNPNNGRFEEPTELL